MKQRRLAITVFSFSLLLLVTACEPLAPAPADQAVVVITNTPTEVVPISPTPVLATPLPTQPPATVPATAGPTDTAAPSPTLPPCSQNEGLRFDSSFDSDITGNTISFRIYLPPCFYESGRRFPYVILFHGSGSDATQWTDDIGIHTELEATLNTPDIAPMVLIMPEGGVPQESNVFTGGESWEDIVLTELIPALERDFCLWNDSEGRAIGGISRGGFWAMSIALRNPGIFSAVGGHSPAFFEDNAPASHNPLDLAAVVSPSISLRIFLDIARADSGAETVGLFSSSLDSRGVEHTYSVSPTGNHNNEYWSAQVRNYLEFYSESWPKTISELPSCF